MIVFKVDVLEELKKKGFTTYQLTKDPGYMNAQTVQNLRNGKMQGIKTLDLLCKLLKCQPSHLLKYVPDDAENSKETKTE